MSGGEVYRDAAAYKIERQGIHVSTMDTHCRSGKREIARRKVRYISKTVGMRIVTIPNTESKKRPYKIVSSYFISADGQGVTYEDSVGA